MDDVPDRYLDVEGVPIRYIDEGRGAAVVLIHSYGSDLEQQWRLLLPALREHHRVIALDLRGHGRSGKPHDPAAYGEHMAWDVVRLLDHLDLDRAHVVGYSMGGHILAQLLTLVPHRIRTAVLGGSAGRREWTPAKARQAEIEAREMEQGLLTSQIVRLGPAGRPPPPEPEARAIAARFLRGKDPLALAAIRRANAQQVITTAALAAVQVPVLGVVGSEDPYLASFEELRRAMPHLELVIVPGATHNMVPSRREFADAVLAFLHRHATADAR